MRLVHVIPVMDPLTGGPPAIAASVLSVLARGGVEGTIICYENWAGDGGIARTREMLAGIPNGQAVQVSYLPPLTRGEVWFAANARKLLPSMLDGADVVHLHGVWDPILPVAANIAKSRNIPYVISTHGMLEPWAVRSRVKKEIFWRLGWGKMLMGASAIHDHKPGPVTVLGRRLPGRVWDIPNGVFAGHVPSQGELAPVWKQMCIRHPALSSRRVVLFLSRLSEQKAPDVLIRAFDQVAEQVGDAVLLLAGADYGELARCKAVQAACKHRDRIVIAGGIFGAEKAAALAMAEVFVLPSRHEGFSVAVLEAMQVEKACVFTDACHFSRAGDLGAAEIVPAPGPGEAPCDEIAAAILRLLTDETRRQDMARRGRMLVENECTWQRVAASYVEMYDSIAPGEWWHEQTSFGGDDNMQPPTWGGAGGLA